MALVLSIALAWGGVTTVTLLSTCAVFVTFLHGQVSDRLREYAEGQQAIPPECSAKEQWYYLAKEVLWVAVFGLSLNYPALLGSFAFLAYPRWRKRYREWQKIW